MVGHSPNIGIDFDPHGAQALLAQAGFQAGEGFPAVEFMVFSGSQEHMEVTRRQFSQILGVEIEYKVVPMVQIKQNLIEEPPHISLFGWAADYPDPDNFLRVGLNKEWTGWPGGAYDKLVEEARRLMDQEERLKHYKKADKILIDEGVILPLTYGMAHLLVKPWVKEYPLSPMGHLFWKDVVIEHH